MTGEQKEIGVQLKSSAGVSPNAVVFIPTKIIRKVEFNPNMTNNFLFDQAGAPAHFKIIVPANAQVGTYTIPILVNISTSLIFFVQIY